jgi:hypothetical protein
VVRTALSGSGAGVKDGAMQHLCTLTGTFPHPTPRTPIPHRIHISTTRALKDPRQKSAIWCRSVSIRNVQEYANPLPGFHRSTPTTSQLGASGQRWPMQSFVEYTGCYSMMHADGLETHVATNDSHLQCSDLVPTG